MNLLLNPCSMAWTEMWTMPNRDAIATKTTYLMNWSSKILRTIQITFPMFKMMTWDVTVRTAPTPPSTSSFFTSSMSRFVLDPMATMSLRGVASLYRFIKRTNTCKICLPRSCHYIFSFLLMFLISRKFIFFAFFEICRLFLFFPSIDIMSMVEI